MGEKLILWDFDGTLACREGLWTGTLVEILRAEEPGVQANRDDLRAHLQAGLPWHTPEIGHPEIRDPTTWWERVTPVFERAFASLGLGGPRAAELAALVPSRFCRADRWHLFDDTLPTLDALARRGWTHVILSNHVPELPSIVTALGIASWFAAIHTSAVTGYEKPHSEAFKIALGTLPGASRVWMVGDNPSADVRGAEDCGIPAILARKSDATVRRQCEGLSEVSRWIE